MNRDASERIDPRRVFALVVGIESYGISDKWDLPGAARDAQRVADWLTRSAGVPDEQVHLLLAPLSRGYQEMPTSQYLSPTQHHVERILFKELPSCDGDLLWIYWAGHGYLDSAHQMLLPYSDATSDWTAHLNLEAALRWWKGVSSISARFRRLIAIGDACRVGARFATKLTFGDQDYGAQPPDPRRRQFTLFASHAGEVAQNLADRGAGQFTDVLMRRLDTTTLDEAVPGLVDIARSLQADFQLLRTNGLAWQRPQFVVDRDWTGSTLFGDHWTGLDNSDSVGPRAPRLDQRAWRELGPVLHGRDIPAYTYDAYRWAFEITGCALPSSHALPPGGLTAIAYDLDNRQGRQRDMPLTLPFVRHLAAWAEDRGWACAADAWVDATQERLGSAPVPTPPEPEPEIAALHVQLTEDEESDGTHWTRMWIFREGCFETVWESDEPLVLASVKDCLAEQLLAKQAGGPGRIEFHVPYGLLEEEFESWELPIGRHRKLIQLGWSYEVVVRCPAERDGVAGEHWQRKWQWFKAHGGVHPEAVHELGDSDVSAALGVILQATEPPVCVLAGVSEHHLMDALDAVLDAGIPIAVWPRRGRATQIRGELAAALADVNRIDVGRLPSLMKALRIPVLSASADATSKEPYPLALMWDDPERVPERRQLS
ncbi:VMAP-C domain-containing protein [Streptacidiphilus fuscans]|uniref:Caspase family protein n=1 Tax=Streptacidiphilus fuscans TaxID=2789292 RepID=A0A931BA98_9ACTN|nr:caspase family protein [Streptacidiphilus fuscans]MBF9071911.1 caspase family protein [Streptacidiphilus fuscans]